MSEWFDTFFDALAHDVWDALVPPEASDAEATWLASRLPLRDEAVRSARRPVWPGTAGAAPCCPWPPRHRGRLRVRARSRRCAPRPTPRVTAVLADMRRLQEAVPTVPGGSFDGAYCMGNSFGYLDAPDTARFLAGVAALLVDGGRFVVDAATAAECLLPHLELGGDDDRHDG